MKSSYDAVVIGSGPNGLTAAITLAQAGLSVGVLEANETIGGGMRSAALTLSGFTHDICSAIHPLGMGSPFFSSLPLKDHGLEWIQPLAPLAHPFEDGSVAILERSIEETCQTLDEDAQAYKNLMDPLVENWSKILPSILGPLQFPAHPLALARFGCLAIRSAQGLSGKYFRGYKAKGLFAGLASHAIMPLDKMLTAAFGLILGALGHTVGWPMPLGGSQNIANALASYFKSLGGEIITGLKVERLEQLPSAHALLFDTSPRQLLNITGDLLPSAYRRKLEKYRYGPGVFKIDWALSNPIPWKAKACLRAGTVHVGGAEAEIALSEKEVWQGIHPEKSYIILAQQSLFDTTRAPPNRHTAWAYCHVPSGSTVDMTSKMEAQIERYAPGFKDCILAKSSMTAVAMEHYNPNYVGGDITGGVEDIHQLFTRPAGLFHPYSTPKKNIYICSASTPPGGGVHGMCGYHAAQAALKRSFNHHVPTVY